jgi:hypothetical protein
MYLLFKTNKKKILTKINSKRDTETKILTKFKRDTKSKDLIKWMDSIHPPNFK